MFLAHRTAHIGRHTRGVCAATISEAESGVFYVSSVLHGGWVNMVRAYTGVQRPVQKRTRAEHVQNTCSSFVRIASNLLAILRSMRARGLVEQVFKL